MTRSKIRFEDSTDGLGFISKVFNGTLDTSRVGTIREAKYNSVVEGLDFDPTKSGYVYEDIENTIRIGHKNLVGLKRKLKEML